jgi:hypothetical protein
VRTPSSSEGLLAPNPARQQGAARGRRGSSQSGNVVRPASDLSHGAHHRGAQKALPVGPRIAVIIIGAQTIIISGGSANSANSTHQLVRAARTTAPVTAAAAAKPPTMKRDEIRGVYGKLFAWTLTGSGFCLDSVFDTVITSTRSLVLVLSSEKDGTERARGTPACSVEIGTRIRIGGATDVVTRSARGRDQ